MISIETTLGRTKEDGEGGGGGYGTVKNTTHDNRSYAKSKRNDNVNKSCQLRSAWLGLPAFQKKMQHLTKIFRRKNCTRLAIWCSMHG